jgi:predicted dehydrogenase
MILYRVNAGFVPRESWIHGDEGGGRAIGEACHMIDLFEYLLDAPAIAVCGESLHPGRSHFLADDNFSCSFRYADGSVASLLYTSVGPKDVEKERVEVFVEGKYYLIDDFKRLLIKGARNAGWRSRISDKGHRQALTAFFDALRGIGPLPISYDSIERSSRLAIQVSGLGSV